MDDRLRRTVLVLAQQLFVDPQTEWMIVAGNFNAALGMWLTLLDVLLRHAEALGILES